jgi:hypothetical protein
LFLWGGLNLLVAVVVTATTLSGRNPPALSILLTAAEIHRLDGKVIAVVNAQAALANPCIVALCLELTRPCGVQESHRQAEDDILREKRCANADRARRNRRTNHPRADRMED